MIEVTIASKIFEDSLVEGGKKPNGLTFDRTIVGGRNGVLVYL
jgi:hypothetical protein